MASRIDCGLCLPLDVLFIYARLLSSIVTFSPPLSPCFSSIVASTRRRNTMTISVLLLGATGYLGGSVLTDLERASEYDVTCVVRPEREACLSGRKTKLLRVSYAPVHPFIFQVSSSLHARLLNMTRLPATSSPRSRTRARKPTSPSTQQRPTTSS